VVAFIQQSPQTCVMAVSPAKGGETGIITSFRAADKEGEKEHFASHVIIGETWQRQRERCVWSKGVACGNQKPAESRDVSRAHQISCAPYSFTLLSLCVNCAFCAAMCSDDPVHMACQYKNNFSIFCETKITGAGYSIVKYQAVFSSHSFRKGNSQLKQKYQDCENSVM
jgi:hypothetical protein